MTKVKFLFGAVAASVVLVAAGCGSSSTGTSPTSTSAKAAGAASACASSAPPSTEAPLTSGTDPAAAVKARTKPSVAFPPLTGKLQSYDLIEGTGDAVVAHDQVTVHYVGVQAKDCKEFDASWTSGEPIKFSLDQVIPGWGQGLVGMKPGGRRLLVIPPDLAYGNTPAQAGAPSGTLGFVVDLVGVGPKAVPAVLDEVTARGKPTVTVPSPLPTTLTVTDLVAGTGTEVKAGMTVVAHYVGVQASDGKEFDSSWSRKEPATFALDQVIPGWRDGLVGMKVGGRRQLVIPGSMAYGDTPQSGQPSGTLVFVVDLVGAG